MQRSEILAAIRSAEQQEDAEADFSLYDIQIELFKLFQIREQNYKVEEILDVLESQNKYLKSWEDPDGDRYWEFTELFNDLPEATKCLLARVEKW